VQGLSASRPFSAVPFFMNPRCSPVIAFVSFYKKKARLSISFSCPVWLNSIEFRQIPQGKHSQPASIICNCFVIHGPSAAGRHRQQAFPFIGAAPRAARLLTVFVNIRNAPARKRFF
jgi:hypothetical protein